MSDRLPSALLPTPSSAFRIESEFQPTGDQPRAIAEMLEGLKRGDKYQTLLGATGTGKSVGYDDPVFVVERVDGEARPRVTAVGPLVDRCLAEGVGTLRHEGGTDVLGLPEGRFFTQAYDPATGETGLFAVSAFTRHAAPEAMHRVTTRCGRSVSLTGDHNLWVLRGGRLVLIETADARPGDALPLPETLASGDARAHLDTLDTLRGAALYVTAQPQVLAYAATHGVASVAGPLADAGAAHPWGKLFEMRHAAGRWGRVRADAFAHLRAATADLGGTFDLDAVSIGGRHGHALARRVALSPAFLSLVGLYVAEGCRTGGYVLFANRDASLRAKLFEALAELGHAYHVRPSSDVQVSSPALAELLGRLCGHGAGAKRLPDFWPSLSDVDLGRLLRAYFDGDGTVGRASEASATTASAWLASDLAYALMRFGIHARTGTRRKRATNSAHAGGTYYQVTVSGQGDLRRFREHVGFTLPYKRAALDRECAREAGSNVDVVPIAGADLRALRHGVALTARALGEAAGVSRSGVGLYEQSQRRPSRPVLKRLLGALEAAALARDHRDVAWWALLDGLRRLTTVRWTPVASVERVAYEHPHVYDFTVPGPETFLAGSGGLFVHNTFSVSNVVQSINRPTLVMSHNKTLAAQLYAEFKSFFPDNAVEFFISYYDYYQPEAYIVHSDTFIEKDMAINEKIDRLRLRATSALVSGRKDVLIVASVSCIYGLGSPDEYKAQIVQVKAGQTIARNDLLHGLVNIFYNRNDVEFKPGAFRVRGDVVEVFPAYMEDTAYRISFWGDEIEKLSVIEALTGKELREEGVLTIYPAKIFVTPKDQLERATKSIEEELRWRLAILRENGQLVEAQRLEQRTLFDIEMMKEVGYCSGIENYSRHLSSLEPGQRPYCLFDYFPDDFLLVIDESHVSVPQVRAMYNGDRARKLVLVEHGFRLPSALDNRPMTFEEFETKHDQVIFVSATPGDYELEKSNGVFVEQVIRPTGIPDPAVEVRPSEGQIDDLLEEVRIVIERKERVLVTTLTKRMAEDLADYLDSFGVAVRYLHSDIDALERVEILRDLRLGAFDVLIGVNLLREGLDLPEVSLVVILDADKEGFLRSDRSLIQTAGRAARNVNSKVIMYADRITGSMERMMDETERRREIQIAYNVEHGITPRTVTKSRDQIMSGTIVAEEKASTEKGPQRTSYEEPAGMAIAADPLVKYLTPDQKRDLIAQMQREMNEAAENLQFELAANLRDSITQLEKQIAAA